MKIPYYHIDSFTKKIFCGNPAGVCILKDWLDDSTMLNIARENGLAETAFIVGSQSAYQIRFFANFSGWKHWGLAPVFRRRTGFVFGSFQSF